MTIGSRPWNAPFASAPVAGRKVGTLTFDAGTITTATLSYSVDGTDVVKNVTRQTWTTQNLSGSYYGGRSGEQKQGISCRAFSPGMGCEHHERDKAGKNNYCFRPRQDVHHCP